MAELGPTSPPTPAQSSFAGDPAQAWSLRKAVDALSQSARVAGKPSSLWVAGLLYPSVGLGMLAGVANLLVDMETVLGHGFEGGGENLLRAIGESIADVVGLLFFAPLLLLSFRLQAGLARIAPRAVWTEVCKIDGVPRLRHAWRAGRGLTSGAGGLNVILALVMGAVLGLVCLPALAVWDGLSSELGREVGALIWLCLLLPGIALLSIYAVMLSILQLVALQSLASNRRGVASAMTHAWRLVKHDPWSTGRTVAVGLMLDLAISVISIGLSTLGGLLPIGDLLSGFVTMALLGFAGVTRAGYWARAYQALGGWLTEACVPSAELGPRL
jgi:hypothetical protein